MKKCFWHDIGGGDRVSLLELVHIYYGYYSGKILRKEYFVCFRLPRSKKQRLIKKFIKNEKNWKKTHTIFPPSGTK